MGFSELDIKKKLIADEKKLTKQAEAAANLAFNTVERLKKERLESSKSIFGMLFEGPSEEDIATAEGIFNDLEKKSETHQEKLKAYIYEKKQLELAAEDEITAANQTEYDKRLQLTRKYLDLKSMLDQAHQLAIIEDDKERQLKQLEFAKENDIKSIEQSEFTEKRKADLKERYERQWLDKKTKLTEQWRKEDEARFQGYLDEANKNREDNETEYFKDLENIREEIRQSGLSDEQLEIEAAQAKYFRLIELAEEYGEDVTDLETAQAKAVADIEKKYANQIKQDKILATQASLDVAARATTSLMMMNDALVDHGLITAKKGFQIAKGVAIAEATISTANAAISAYKSVVGVPYVGPILAPIAAGVAVAAGGAQIAMISAQTFDGGGGGAVSSPSAGGGASTQSAGGGGAPQFNTVGTSGFNQVAGSIANQNQEPIKAYVVANDVTSQQSLDRNSRDKSSF